MFFRLIDLKDIKRKISNFIFYGWRMRNVYRFDCSSLYQAMNVAMTELDNQLINGFSVYTKKQRRKLLEAIEITRRLTEDEYFWILDSNKVKHSLNRLSTIIEKHSQGWWD